MVDYGSEITSRIKGKSKLVVFIYDFILNPIGPSFSFYPAGGLRPCLSEQDTNGPRPCVGHIALGSPDAVYALLESQARLTATSLDKIVYVLRIPPAPLVSALGVKDVLSCSGAVDELRVRSMCSFF